jgi:acetyltransferase-like isoleucine patch superfamily enzyme
MILLRAITKFWKGFVYVLQHPLKGMQTVTPLVRGLFYIVYFRIIRSRVTIRFPFFAHEKVIIVGPGHVFIDRFCSVFPNTFKGLTVVTLSPSAIVRIGRHCALSGLTIRCLNKVSLGNNTMTAYSLIQDNLVIAVDKCGSRFRNTLPLYGKSIEIGKNVWIGAQACILSGTSIGDDAVISLGSVCLDTSVGEYHLAVGNPVVRSAPINQILNLKQGS